MIPTALLSTLGAFALILLLARLKVPLAPAILSGALATGLLFRTPPVKLLGAFVDGAIHPMTIGLIVIVIALLTLSEMMKQAGLLEEIVSQVRALLRRPITAMAALPAIIGLLPMPGGALFSAPMVAATAGESNSSGGDLSAVNYWFRHVWEYWWPLYPGVILAVSLISEVNSQLGWWGFIARQLPLSVFMIGAGLVILRRLHPELHEASPAPPPGTRRRLLRSAAPIWGILLIWLAGTLAMYLVLGEPPKQVRSAPALRPGELAMAAMFRFGPLTLGLLASLVYTAISGRVPGKKVVGVLKNVKTYKLAALVLATMIFQYVLKFVGAPSDIGAEMENMHVPVELVVALLPFIAGMVTGLAVGFVGTSFPVILGLVATIHGAAAIGPYVVLAYAFGHMGQMISPLHLCQIMSNQYFKTGYRAVYRRIIPAAIITAILASAYFFLLRWTM